MRFLIITGLALTLLLGLTASASANHSETSIDVVDCRSDGICTVVDGAYDTDGTRVDPATLCADAGLGATITTWYGVSYHNGYRQVAVFARCYAI